MQEHFTTNLCVILQMENQFYKEEQKINPGIAWLIIFPVLTLVNIIFGVGIYQQISLGKPWGDEPLSDGGLISITIGFNLFIIGMLFLMLKIKLILEIRESGLIYRYLPFIFREKKISRSEIERFEVRQYKAIQEYGGWGFRQRRRFQNKGLAYNVRGNIGLQLYLKNGKKILFGTQRKEAINAAMQKMMGGRN
jgi:hypothetical protein